MNYIILWTVLCLSQFSMASNNPILDMHALFAGATFVNSDAKISSDSSIESASERDDDSDGISLVSISDDEAILILPQAKIAKKQVIAQKIVKAQRAKSVLSPQKNKVSKNNSASNNAVDVHKDSFLGAHALFSGAIFVDNNAKASSSSSSTTAHQASAAPMSIKKRGRPVGSKANIKVVKKLKQTAASIDTDEDAMSEACIFETVSSFMEEMKQKQVHSRNNTELPTSSSQTRLLFNNTFNPDSFYLECRGLNNLPENIQASSSSSSSSSSAPINDHNQQSCVGIVSELELVKQELVNDFTVNFSELGLQALSNRSNVDLYNFLSKQLARSDLALINSNMSQPSKIYECQQIKDKFVLAIEKMHKNKNLDFCEIITRALQQKRAQN